LKNKNKGKRQSQKQRYNQIIKRLLAVHRDGLPLGVNKEKEPKKIGCRRTYFCNLCTKVTKISLGVALMAYLEGGINYHLNGSQRKGNF
jgi:hypothetical protein